MPSTKAATSIGPGVKNRPSAGTRTAAPPAQAVIQPRVPSRPAIQGVTTAAAKKPAPDAPTAMPSSASPSASLSDQE